MYRGDFLLTIMGNRKEVDLKVDGINIHHFLVQVDMPGNKTVSSIVLNFDRKDCKGTIRRSNFIKLIIHEI